MKKCHLRIIALFTLVMTSSLSCTEGGADNSGKSDLKISGISIPTSVSTSTGEEVIFKVYGQGPLAEDKVVLVSQDSQEYSLPVSTCTGTSFGFVVPDGLYTGRYILYIERGGDRVKVGDISLDIEINITFVPSDGTTVYGVVLCDGVPVPGVVVSDGYECDVTDDKGIYELKSLKNHGYVFMSIPSGYTVRRDGALPLFHQYLRQDASTLERADFTLVRDEGQDSHTMVVMGDIHLANRNHDVNQFQTFVNDLNAYMASCPETNFYGLTLGDMSWDQYWISNGYDLTNYLDDIRKLDNLTVFNTIGNHDHEQMASGDFNTVSVYKRIVGPTYYSFNIGQVHYVVLDDIECTNPGNGTRTYNTTLVQEQIDWLAKDLSYVSADTPVVVAMHSPVYTDKGESRLGNSEKLVAALGDRTVHYFTGHTHVMYNVDKNSQYEHNAGAVCATWWWTNEETPGIHISTDGTPGGYLLFHVDGKDMSWVFKPTGKDIDHQFRTYDRNTMSLTRAAYVPDANEENSDKFMSAASAYSSASSANEVYINVWNYDPKWTIEVMEGGVSLDVSQVTGKDPLHLISYSAKRLNRNKVATFLTGNTSHLFKVVASSATSTLDIKVTDRFGNVYTEKMTRPKEFTAEIYK